MIYKQSQKVYDTLNFTKKKDQPLLACTLYIFGKFKWNNYFEGQFDSHEIKKFNSSIVFLNSDSFAFLLDQLFVNRTAGKYALLMTYEEFLNIITKN